MDALTPANLALDWRNPEYDRILRERTARAEYIEEDPKGRVPLFLAHYKTHPWDLINDWGVTFDPRNLGRGIPAIVPFVLFPAQIEWCKWVMERWQKGEPGLSDKSRDMGLSWLAVSFASALCITHESMAIGFGSRKEEYVDKAGAPKALFYKARMFLRGLPPWFRAGHDPAKHAPHMRIEFPHRGSVITGEAGDNIGRGDRSSLYFVDESAFLERPQLVEASLSQTTNCRIDISSANGMDNPFAVKRHNWPDERIFTLHWRRDPRKDDAWYEKQKELLDPVTLAQEVDINYQASKTGIMIPSDWVQSSIDAHKVLGFEPTGVRLGALDVADEGVDLNAFARRHGVLLQDVTAWSGKGSDTFATALRAFDLADEYGVERWFFDADGLGAGIRGDARVINEGRKRPLTVEPFRGSATGEGKDGKMGLYRPNDPIPSAEPNGGGPRKDARRNIDYFANLKAQSWWELRVRFQRTFRAVQIVKAGGVNPYDPDELISLSSAMPELVKLTQELSQPTYSLNTAGKVLVNKQPDNTRSPNHADAVMIAFAPRRRGLLDYLT